MIRHALVACLVLFLAACATKPEPEVRIVTVNVPVPVPCIPDDLSGPQLYPDTDAALRAAHEIADFEKLLYAGRKLRDKRLEALEAVVETCRHVNSAPQPSGSGALQ